MSFTLLLVLFAVLVGLWFGPSFLVGYEEHDEAEGVTIPEPPEHYNDNFIRSGRRVFWYLMSILAVAIPVSFVVELVL